MTSEASSVSAAVCGTNPVWPDEPYKGLDFFSTSDAPLFSQRDREIEDCAIRLDDLATRVLLLHGFSGMGKSSFLRAGLNPRLQERSPGQTSFLLPCNGVGEPIIIRATNDPVERIHEGLSEIVRLDPTIPATLRNIVTENLSNPPNPDRKLAAATLIEALRELTTMRAETWVLAIDQAEEVLTLPHQTDAKAFNRRSAFFYLLEQICIRRLRMRLIVSCRTEYYGRFCSFFGIPSTLTITSAALPRAGLVGYYLQPISEPDRLAAIVRRPTLTERVGALPAPRAKYGFEFAPGVVEEIVRDLINLSGDSSTLPVLQVVCKRLFEVCKAKGRTKIGWADYNEIGGVEGGLDSHIDRGIERALKRARRPGRSFQEVERIRPDPEIERWREVLCHLIGQQEVGTVGLILHENQLVGAARKERVKSDPVLVLRAMTDDKGGLLRPASPSGAGDRVYSLRHECLGGALSRWLEKHGERLKQQEEIEQRVAQQKRFSLLTIGILACVVLSGFGVSAWFILNSESRSIRTLEAVAEQQTSSHLRERLLMLVAARQRADAWPWVFGSGNKRARLDLEETLLRAPVFGGSFQATLDPAGEALAYLNYDGETGDVVLLDLKATWPRTSTTIPQPIKISLGGISSGGAGPPPTIGYIELEAQPVRQALAVGPGSVPNVSSGRKSILIAPGTPSSRQVPIHEGDFGTNAPFPPTVDFGNGSLRLSYMTLAPGGLPNSFNVMTTRAFSDAETQLSSVESSGRLDWDPSQQAAPRVPVLAVDCDRFAFLAFPPVPPLAVRKEVRQVQTEPRPPWAVTQLFYGEFNGRAGKQEIRYRPLPQSESLSSVGIARGCGAALVRVAQSSRDLGTVVRPDKLIVVDLKETAFGDSHSYDTPVLLNGFVPQAWPLISPSLVAAPTKDARSVRAAWLIDAGLAVVDLQQGTSPQANSVLDGELNGKALPFLTGLDPTQSLSRMTISRYGDFLLLSQQRTFMAKPEVRVFDLRIALHKKQLENEKRVKNTTLITEACRLASFLDGGAQLKLEELIEWYGDENAAQPCQK